MEDLKIKVSSESESKEAQELFFELGYDFYFGGKLVCNTNLMLIAANSNGLLSNILNDGVNYKEITLQQLHDLVVLKRNSVEDATHTDSNKLKYYIGDSRYILTIDGWKECIINDLSELKTIEKEMKEYLRKDNEGNLFLFEACEREAQELHARDWIEVPEGATSYIYPSVVAKRDNKAFFYKDGLNYFYLMGQWCESGIYHPEETLWQRPTQPESLPFVDDEPRMTSIKTKWPTLNDQMAEVEAVRQTLKEREKQYGSFESVSDTTQRLLKVLKDGDSFDDFSDAQIEALHMICSKLARLSNGDVNHKDSWHDIQGYAKLIEDLI